jgi:hypothetical protein
LPRRLSRTGKQKPSKVLESLTGFIYARTLCRENQGTAKTKREPVTVGNRVTYKILSPERTSFGKGIY